MVFMTDTMLKNRPYRIEYFYRPGRYWTDEQVRQYHAELEQVARDCFRQIPRYQCLAGTRKDFERAAITVARDMEGHPVGFCSAVILDVEGYKNVLHLGLTCVKKKARNCGLTHFLTSRLLFNYLVRTSMFRSIWVTNVACVISSLGNVALYFENVFPSPFGKPEPDDDHIRIALAIDHEFRTPVAINKTAVLDLDAFVFRKSVGNTVFQKSRKDRRYYHRNSVLTDFYLNRLNFQNGDEVLQVARVSLMSYPKYLFRLSCQAFLRFVPVSVRRKSRGQYSRKIQSRP